MLMRSYKIFYKQNSTYYNFIIKIDIGQYHKANHSVYIEIFPTNLTIFTNFVFNKIDAIYDSEFSKSEFNDFVKNYKKNNQTKVYTIIVTDLLLKLQSSDPITRLIYEYKIMCIIPKKAKEKIKKLKNKIDKITYKNMKFSFDFVCFYEKLRYKNNLTEIYRKIEKCKNSLHKIFIITNCSHYLDVQSLVFILQSIDFSLLRYHERIFFTYWVSNYFYTRKKEKLGYYYLLQTRLIIQDSVNMRFSDYLSEMQICQPGWNKVIHELYCKVNTSNRTFENKKYIDRNYSNNQNLFLCFNSDECEYIHGVYVPESLTEKQTIKCKEFVTVIIENRTEKEVYIEELHCECESKHLRIHRPLVKKLYCKIRIYENINVSAVSYIYENVKYIQRIETVNIISKM